MRLRNKPSFWEARSMVLRPCYMVSGIYFSDISTRCQQAGLKHEQQNVDQHRSWVRGVWLSHSPVSPLKRLSVWFSQPPISPNGKAASGSCKIKQLLLIVLDKCLGYRATHTDTGKLSEQTKTHFENGVFQQTARHIKYVVTVPQRWASGETPSP